MTRHLADHRETTTGGRVKHFLRIARQKGETMWDMVRRQPSGPHTNRRVLEYVRIERGRRV